MSNRSQRREIPGFYFDEEKNRYFAIPSSANVAEFNTKEIQKLNSKNQHKRKKQKINLPLTEREKTELDRKEKQDNYYSQLEKLYLSTFDLNFQCEPIKQLLDKQWNTINPTRPIQYLILKNIFYLNSNTAGNIVGMRLVRFSSDSNNKQKIYGITFYSMSNSSVDIEFTIRNISFLDKPLSVDISKNPERRDLTDLVSHDSYCSFSSGFNGFLTYKEPNDNQKKYSAITPKIQLSDKIYCIYKHHKYIIFNENIEITKEKSEITCMFLLKGYIAYGCRNGNAYIIQEGRKIHIEFGSSICSIVLLYINDCLYCVISGINNKLMSYLIDEEKKKAVFYMYYYNYKNNYKLCNNMKSNFEINDTIFCIESESNESNKLELLIYSVLCAKPLKLKSGLFLVENNDKSDISWFLYKKSMFIFQKESQQLLIYQPLSDII